MATRSHRAVNHFAMANSALRYTKRQLHRSKRPAPTATSTQLPRHRVALHQDIEEAIKPTLASWLDNWQIKKYPPFARGFALWD